MPFDNSVPRQDSPAVARLKAATRRIKRRWVKRKEITSHTDVDGHFGFCLIGSLRYDDYGARLNADQKAEHYLYQAVSILMRTNTDPVSYNDCAARMKEDVVLALEIATELAEHDEIVTVK